MELCRGDKSLINKNFQGVVVIHLPLPRSQQQQQQSPTAQPKSGSDKRNGGGWNWRDMGNWRNIFITRGLENNINDKLSLGNGDGDGDNEKRQNDERKEGNGDVRDFSARGQEGQKSPSLLSSLRSPLASPTARIPGLAGRAQQRIAQAAHQTKQVLGSLSGLLQNSRPLSVNSPSSSSHPVPSSSQSSLLDDLVSYVKLRSASPSPPSLSGLSLGGRGSGGRVGQPFFIPPSAAPAGGFVMPSGR